MFLNMCRYKEIKKGNNYEEIYSATTSASLLYVFSFTMKQKQTTHEEKKEKKKKEIYSKLF